MLKRLLAGAALSALVATVPAAAHFQSIYTPAFNLTQPGDVPLKLIFWHPLVVGPNVDMPMPNALYSVSRGERTDLMESLRPISFSGPQNAAAAYDATLPLRRVGDHVIVLETGLYYDEISRLYIEQFVKAVLNLGAVPTDWDVAIGLPTEIVPMTKPYNVLAGSTFTGRVLSNGEPVPFLDVDVVYLSAEPDMATNTVGTPTISPPPGGYITVKTDRDGVFTFGVPYAGFWGFGALGSGPETSIEIPPEDTTPVMLDLGFGEIMPVVPPSSFRPLSQDAILWIEAFDLR